LRAHTKQRTRAALFGMGPDLNEVYVCLEFQSFLKSYTARRKRFRGVTRPVGPLRAPAPEPTTPALSHEDYRPRRSAPSTMYSEGLALPLACSRSRENPAGSRAARGSAAQR
jgi:hypothetical protein